MIATDGINHQSKYLELISGENLVIGLLAFNNIEERREGLARIRLIRQKKVYGIYLIRVMNTSGFATTHVVIPGHCKEKFCFENPIS